MMSNITDVESTVREWQSRFDILRNWEIRFCHLSEHKGKVTTNPDLPVATFFPWPDANVPEDFYLHEMLHLALRQYKRIPEAEDFDAEERLVQDICNLWKKQTSIEL